jgi:uncharacterized protein (TIGR02145 family)
MKIFNFSFVFIVLISSKLICFSQKTVKIGTQEWTIKNLDVVTFRNGDPIPEARNKTEWNAATVNKVPAWCYYEFDQRNGKAYGKIYNWYAVNDVRGLAPSDFKIPSNSDWETLINYLGKIGISTTLKSKKGWESKQGTNKSGFSALPGGYVTENGKFSKTRESGYWWSSDEYVYTSDEEVEQVEDTDVEIFSATVFFIRGGDEEGHTLENMPAHKGNGYSVRCLRNKEEGN